MIKAVSILGSTGSIGRQSIAAAKHLGVPVVALTANKKTDLVDSDRQDLFLADRYFVIFRLNNTLSVHSIYNFFEACDVCALD